MKKLCMLMCVLAQFHLTSFALNAGADESKYLSISDTVRSLLRQPVDEEHDELGSESDETHAHEWTIQIHTGDEKAVKEIANSYDFDVVSKVGVGDGVYRFLNVERKGQEKRESLLQELGQRLGKDKRILWYKRERILTREKRTPVNFKVNKVPNRDTSLDDPQFENQWYIRNDGQTAGPSGFDSNVVPVWNMGYTGKDVSISVLDDGMDHTHPDLIGNYDPIASKDLNGHDNDPFPNDSDPYNAHGTKCSGTIAATGNNSLCGVGIAFDSKIGAIRMLDGKATDGLEADALSFHRDHIQIYSCSWGPKDNGKTFGRPGRLGRISLAQGAKYGRKGLGSLFVWATGNGGIQKDDCNADGYVNSIYTMGIGSVNEHGVSTYYGERCSAMFAVTYCSGRHSILGGNSRANVITTYLHHQCTQHFVGTSSAAPLAAGILALVLEANPNLTWRDMQHLLFHTAKKTSPLDTDWQVNGCGKAFNHKFGFGLLDAYLLVNLALNWTSVPEQRRCHFRLRFKNGDIPSRRHFKLNFTTDGCQSCKSSLKMKDGKCKNAIEKLEHVVVNVTLRHRRRGDLSVSLISPHGSVSNLLRKRPYDNSDAGLKGWRFMTVFNWCENPNGTWQLVFQDDADDDDDDNKRDLEELYMNFLDEQKRRGKKEQEVKLTKAELKEVESLGKEKDEEVNDERKKEKGFKNIFEKFIESEKNQDTFTVNTEAERKRDAANAKKSVESEYFVEDPYHRDVTYRREKESVDENEDPYYSPSYRRRDYDVGSRFAEYNRRRKRRDAVKKNDIDEDYLREIQSKEKKEIIYQNPVLKRSSIAGEVLAIAVTFYGTAG